MALVVGPATAQDFLDYAGALPPYRALAWAARLDGRVIGLGGLLYLPDGGRYAFLDVGDEARRFHKTLHATAIKFMRHVCESNIGPIVATTTTNVPRANEWLTRLGFRSVNEGETRVFIFDG